ncbi:MAG: NYN domain-containing protein, partial [Verrucomicrobiota bacterium]
CHMRILIVDGHSVIFKWPEMRRLHTRRMTLARDAVIRLLTEYQDSTGVHVVAVFDGKGASKSTETTEPGGIQVFYSGADRTADDIIERLAATYAGEHDITVATSDMLEQQTVISFGAQAVSTETLKTMIEEAQGDLQRRLKQHRK